MFMLTTIMEKGKAKREEKERKIEIEIEINCKPFYTCNSVVLRLDAT